MFGEKCARCVLFCGAVLGLAGWAQAQQPEDYRNYMNIYNRPTLSPYLALVPQASPSGVLTGPPTGIYQTYIKPQTDQNDYRFRQSITAQNQPYVPSPLGPGYQAKSPQTTGFANNVRPTGHSSTYMNLSHYYPNAVIRPHH